jgi:hypothetical protein
MGLPARFFGAWERRDLTVDGIPAADAGRAVWVQAGPWFVDIRGPGGFASDTSFAGCTKWAEPYLEWEHTVDQERAAAGVDRGRITLDADDLLEEGGFIAGEHRSYRERWRRISGRPAPVLAAVGPGGVAVRVGDHAAVVLDERAHGRGFAAQYARLTASGWEAELLVDEGLPILMPAPLEPTAQLPTGWTWRTNE